MKVNVVDRELAIFQIENCCGCRFADDDVVGTGAPCCRYSFMLPKHIAGDCLTKVTKDPDAEYICNTCRQSVKRDSVPDEMYMARCCPGCRKGGGK